LPPVFWINAAMMAVGSAMSFARVK
jgi:hypothetical protein